MLGLQVKTDNSVHAVQANTLEDMQNAVGGFIEVVHPQGLEHPLVMLVDEEGLLKGKEPNPVGCWLYRTHQHGQPIVGDILILQEDGEELQGFSMEDISDMVMQVEMMKGRMKEAMKV